MVTAGGGPTLLEDFVRHHAARQPESAALLDSVTASTWSWAELDRRAVAIAGVVRALGLGPDERVGLVLGGTALGVAALHGMVRATVSAVLVHPKLAAPEVESLLALSACRALLIDPATGVAAPTGIAAVALDEIDVDARIESVATAVATAEPLPEFLLATSGSTARPKLARLPLDRIAASAEAWTTFLPPASGWLLSLGLAHVAGIGIVARAARAGVPVVVPGGPGAAALLAAIDGAASRGVVVSHLSLVAAQLAAILDATEDGPPPDGIAAVILGGGPLPESLLLRAVAAGWPVIPSYGMTETASGVVALAVAEVASHAGTAGRALPRVDLRLDGGRIAVRGPMVFPGYLGDPGPDGGDADTDPTGPDAHGWFHTGDLGTLDADGRLTVLGRVDDVIVSGGEKVAPAEVEAVLLEHPDVRDAAVVGIPDPTWGNAPAAVVVLQRGADPSDDDLRAHARARLAGYKVPIRFVRVAALPRTDLGKVAGPALARLLAEPIGRIVTADDGQRIAIRELAATAGDPEAPVVVLLHATLSTSAQLLALARRLADHARVVLVDRRGSGDSPMANPAPVRVARHVADVVAVLDAVGAVGTTRTALVGHSFGAVVALETAARHPDRVASVFAWEPPYLAVAAPPVRAELSRVAGDVATAFAAGGGEAAAHRFLDAVAGAGAWDRLHPRQRDSIGREGTGALADAAMDGLEPDGLARITCPVVIASGGASEPFYAPIADELAARIGPHAVRERLPGLRHTAPITDAALVADLAVCRHIDPDAQETAP